ncbi:hypothetical protein B7P43_G08923 [Cryptotermes secundus]|uniref:Transposable element P transposase-like RNase H domain-containing protein n=1 Tax=Cryptotermes secundus TaxID=105785 RepID=A0A2J7PEG8_9NEOP|nr:hypothetical protein B7P43_G08923 [Cryptotermes secundus]
MFDEMSIRENLHFNQKFDCIGGFEDCGSQGRTCSIANHALLFMIHDLLRKWKQPVAYYFTRGSTKAEMIVQYLKEVLDACQNAGLKVVATVCDMGANNVMALNCWVLPEGNHSSDFAIKKLQQCMIHPTF